MNDFKENKMGKDPILKLIITMSLPAMFSMLIQALYNVVDSMFVAQISEKALTAISLAFPLQILMIAVAVGTGVGINSLVSRRLGEKNMAEADSAATHGIILGVISWLVFAILGIFFSRPFFEIFTTDQVVIEMGSQYAFVVLVFSFGVFIQINMEKTLQATGDMMHPMMFQLVGAVTNIILDPIFIFVFKMGVQGAAIATVIGQIFALIYSTYVIFGKNHQVKINFKNFKFSGKMVKEIYAVGIPSIIMQAISSVLTMLLNGILIGFSGAAVSVLGVYYKVQSFIFMPVFGLTSGIMPIMGYNFGARNKKRLMDTLKYGAIFASIIMFLGMIVFWAIPDKLLMIFKASEEMMNIGIPAFRIVSTCFIPAALGITFSTLLQAVGMGGKSLFISILRQLVVILPAAYFLAKIDLYYFWFAFPLSEVAALIASCIIFVFVYKNRLSKIETLEK